MSSIQFRIHKLYALSPGLVQPEDWLTWHQNHGQWPSDPAAVPADRIPAMMRRRMSALSKIAVQVAAELSDNEEIAYTIFSSRHGELQRTIQLLQDILSGEDASPTAFSQSVHNTAAGLFTIATQQAIPASSIAGGDDGFHYALLEAFTFLHDQPDKKVLVIDFDAPLPEVYSRFAQYTSAPYALGMVIGAGDAVTLTRSAPDNHCPSGAPLPQALAFYRHWLNGDRQFSLQSQRQQWRWEMAEATCSR